MPDHSGRHNQLNFNTALGKKMPAHCLALSNGPSNTWAVYQLSSAWEEVSPGHV